MCKKTFLFLHNTGEFCFRAQKTHYLTEGLVPRIHGHAGRTALVLEDVRGIVLFVLQ